MSEPNSAQGLANVMQDPDQGHSQAQTQDPSQDTSTEQQPESESKRVNGLMSTLGKRTNERDAAARERDQAIAERDQAQQALDAIVRQHTAQPTQAEVLAADEAERAPAPAPEQVTDTDGNVLMTESQWQAEERAGRTFAPVTPMRPQVRRDARADDLAALDRAITQAMR